MKPRSPIIGLLVLLFAWSAVTAGTDEGITWRFEIDNDIIFNSDNQFSNGWSLQRHGPPAERWEDARRTPAFGKRVARWFLPVRQPDLLFREGWAIGQNIQTPNDLERTEPIANDVPYAASLAVLNSWIAFDDRDFHGFGWLFGVVGPVAFGEEIQRPVHEAIDSPDPRGWDNQIDNVPVLNIYYERRRKFWRHRNFDVTGTAGAQLGNGITGADMALEFRMGRRLPRGFVYTPDPIGRRLSHHARLPLEPDQRSAFYTSLVARASSIAYFIFIDGADDFYEIEREDPIGALIVGLHYQRRTWGIHANLWFTTDTIDPGIAVPDTDTSNDVGTLMFEFRH